MTFNAAVFFLFFLVAQAPCIVGVALLDGAGLHLAVEWFVISRSIPIQLEEVDV